MPSDFGAAAGGRLGRVRLSPWDVWGEGKDTFPSPSHPFHPQVREVGVGSNGGLWLELDRGGGLLIDVKHCARVEEGRRRLARGRVHTSLGLGGARPLRMRVRAGGIKGGVRTERMSWWGGRRRGGTRAR